MPKVRQEDLARAANVSVSTVSLALRDHPSISPATKKRVMDLQKKLGYEPQKKSVIGPRRETPRLLFCLLRRSPSSPLYNPFLEGVVSASKKWKAQLDIDFVRADEKVSDHAFVMQNGERPDGIIFAGEVTEEFVAKGEASADHVIVIGSHHLSRPVHHVETDLLAAARMTVSRVIKDGFQHAALVYLKNNDFNEDYAAALKQAAREQGLSLPEKNIFAVSDFLQDAGKTTAAIANLNLSPLAVISTVIGFTSQIISSMPPKGPKCSHYSVVVEAEVHHNVAALEFGPSRLGIVAVDRICHLVSGDPDLREPYTCLIPPIGWVSTKG